MTVIPPVTPPGIELTFIGICTHLWADQPNAPDNISWGKRVVMGNGSDPARIEGLNLLYGLDPPVMPHVATLSFLESQIVSIEGPKLFVDVSGNKFTVLDGVTVTVGNPAGDEMVKDARCLPGLGSWVAAAAPGPAATSGDARQAAGYFDYTSGTLTGKSLRQRGSAAALLYTVETSGPPQIVITPFDPALPPTTVTLTAETVAQVEILNVPAIGEKDNDNDFVLHFLVASQFPDQWPPSAPLLGIACQPHPNSQQILLRHSDRVSDDFGIGCSNSNIP